MTKIGRLAGRLETGAHSISIERLAGQLSSTRPQG